MLQKAQFADELRDHEKGGTHAYAGKAELDRFHGSPYRYNLERVVYGYNPNASSGDISALADFLRMFLHIGPDDRCTPRDALQHRWLGGNKA